MKKPIALDLFCGAGGLTEGLRQAGFRVIGAVEIDQLASRTYKSNHPKVKLWTEDITRISGKAMMEVLGIRPGDLDLLAACPPCQGFSAMRTKNGSRRNRDPMNSLIFQVLRMVRSMKPKCVMLENVPGLSKSVKYAAFRKGLLKLGYQINWKVLNAVDYGVPQRRRRLVLLASQTTRPDFVEAEAPHKTVKQFIGTLSSPTRSRDPLHNYSSKRSERIQALIKKIPRDGGSRESLGKEAQLKCHRRLDRRKLGGFRDVYGRMSWNKPSPTITGGCINPSKGRFLHPHEHRPITLREAALLQTFPKSYYFPTDLGRFPIALMIGNALPPEFIRRLAVSLKKLLHRQSGSA